VHENKITPEKPSFEGVLFMNFHYIDSIKIEKFKCFADFNVDGLKRVNLIGGKNNVGKTAFLEACFLIVNTFNLQSIEKVYLEKNKVNEDIDRLEIEVLKLLITIQQNRDRSSFVTQWLYEEVDLTSIGFFVVEGTDDKKFIEKLLVHLIGDNEIDCINKRQVASYVFSMGGKSKLLDANNKKYINTLTPQVESGKIDKIFDFKHKNFNEIKAKLTTLFS
jgi:AAA15 family ATPase/GTPase